MVARGRRGSTRSQMVTAMTSASRNRNAATNQKRSCAWRCSRRRSTMAARAAGGSGTRARPTPDRGEAVRRARRVPCWTGHAESDPSRDVLPGRSNIRPSSAWGCTSACEEGRPRSWRAGACLGGRSLGIGSGWTDLAGGRDGHHDALHDGDDIHHADDDPTETICLASAPSAGAEARRSPSPPERSRRPGCRARRRRRRHVGGLTRKAALAALTVAFRSPFAVMVDGTRSPSFRSGWAPGHTSRALSRGR
jgi:hypothetical protein